MSISDNIWYNTNQVYIRLQHHIIVITRVIYLAKVSVGVLCTKSTEVHSARKDERYSSV